MLPVRTHRRSWFGLLSSDFISHFRFSLLFYNLRDLSFVSFCKRWHVKKRDPGYSLDTIYSELVKFGDVTDIVRTCELSARATFCHLANACDAVSRKYIGRDANPLMILWYHRTMKNKTFHLWNRHLHVHVDPFT